MLSHDVVSCRSLQSDKVRYGCLSTIGTHEGLRTQIITNSARRMNDSLL
jgi:hypothetical protein